MTGYEAEATFALDDASLLDGIATLRWHLDDLLEAGPTVVVDVSRLSGFSSVTLAALLYAQRRCRARGAQIVLIGTSPRCAGLLSRAGLLDVFCVTSASSRPVGRP